MTFVGAAATAISIHALLAESDGAATNTRARHLNFYPRSPCGERLNTSVLIGSVLAISIHALLAESDLPMWIGRYPM